MAVDYHVLYALLVCEIDDAIEMIMNDVFFDRVSKEEFIEVAKKLKKAILLAEDTYLDQTEDTSTSRE